MEMTAHPAGTFCWIELATTDVADKQFYRSLFDGSIDDVPAGGGAYTLARQNGRDLDQCQS